jgi:uncharacterized protein YndB with AHSA1/START domain
MQLTRSVTIDAPVEVVFEGWADLERSPEHQRPTIERTRLTEGPIGAGTRYRAVDQWPGRKVAFEMEIATFEPPYLIEVRWEDPMEGGWSARFEDLNGATRMSFETMIAPKGIMGMLSPLMKPWASRQLAEGLDSFRSWVEASDERSPS